MIEHAYVVCNRTPPCSTLCHSDVDALGQKHTPWRCLGLPDEHLAPVAPTAQPEHPDSQMSDERHAAQTPQQKLNGLYAQLGLNLRDNDPTSTEMQEQAMAAIESLRRELRLSEASRGVPATVGRD